MPVQQTDSRRAEAVKAPVDHIGVVRFGLDHSRPLDFLGRVKELSSRLSLLDMGGELGCAADGAYRPVPESRRSMDPMVGDRVSIGCVLAESAATGCSGRLMTRARPAT